MNSTVKLVLVGLFLTVFTSCKNEKEQLVESPNVILIVTDDQAYGDVSFTNNPLAETPILDNLAKEGAFANHFYVSPVCAPTRASLLTGRYHQRTGVSGVTRGRENMNLNETTLADIFKSFGYKTGAFGKWHNGAHYPYHPLGRGFDEFVGFTSGHWTNYFDTTIEKNGKPFKTEGYLPDVLTNEAIRFISESNKENTPFLCYIPFQTPHTPLQVPDTYFDKYKQKGVDDFNATIYGMGENIDDNVGRILKELDSLNIRENTIVIYMSDNGPLNYRFNQGLKGRKGMVDEGGVRVPFIINWKNNINTGQIIHQSLAHIDVLPTLLDLIDKEYQYKKSIDGISFKPLLQGEKDFLKRKLFSEWSGKKRVLSNNYLMINDELFNIEKDPAQTSNIREDLPKVYDSLVSSYNQWYSGIEMHSETKEIPVGYSKYPTTVLPAHEANLYPPFEFRKDRRHTGIAYHSLYGWAHDWIDFWTNTSAYAQWEIEVVEEGDYEIHLQYALDQENLGVKLQVEIGNQELIVENLEVFEHSKFKNNDRVQREQEAPETDWNLIIGGTLKLNKGIQKVKISSIEIPGGKSIELKAIHLRKIKL
ncbi:Arylsulfatase A [Lutibacter agarilyticus]|uniref:Arylsulfatase A n=1 Tax=Lutibacter agarilyticus TaxID=1109740 RepID=A0A238WYK4_9FLAO|nr:arylsulfatase [Lutibacter agarilyticus]SNR51294.1 Arylsulfatase A [Lutibacter agarilyticus]